MKKIGSVLTILLTLFILGVYIRNLRQPDYLKSTISIISPPPIITNITTDPTIQTAVLGKSTKNSGCVIKNSLPDKDCSPGEIFERATKEQICTKGYSTSVRDVPVSVKNEVYKEYGITHRDPGEYEVDHLISLELGGSNDISNLWPEPADPTPGYHEKDLVENYLHDKLCKGNITLLQAQQTIADDWVIVYHTIAPKQ